MDTNQQDKGLLSVRIFRFVWCLRTSLQTDASEMLQAPSRMIASVSASTASPYTRYSGSAHGLNADATVLWQRLACEEHDPVPAPGRSGLCQGAGLPASPRATKPLRL